MIGPFGKSPKVSHHARAVVTGAGSGIGAAFAIELAQPRQPGRLQRHRRESPRSER